MLQQQSADPAEEDRRTLAVKARRLSGLKTGLKQSSCGIQIKLRRICRRTMPKSSPAGRRARPLSIRTKKMTTL